MQNKESLYDVIVIGGGASGLMCAYTAGFRGLRVLVLEKGPKVGLKILVSGGGRCNFTNLYADPREQYISNNPHFCISAMKRYQPSDFIQQVELAGIDYHEKKLGQLFCNDSSKSIVAMLVAQCNDAGVNILTGQEVRSVAQCADGTFSISTQAASYSGAKVVLASGGLSLPKISSDLAFRVANELGIGVIAPRAGLVPLLWSTKDRAIYSSLSGISLEVNAQCAGVQFRENMLFTHRGLSGPVILQVSSYWREGDEVHIDLLPGVGAIEWLSQERQGNPQKRLATILKSALPNRLVDVLTQHWFEDCKIGSCTPAQLEAIGEQLNAWPFKPSGSEGYRTAEVTLGGIDTNEISSKTFELNKVPGLFAIGEAVDVTGWLGGYNFQWAWASGWCCAQHL